MSLIKVGIIVEIFLFVGVFLWVRKLTSKEGRQPSLSKKTIKNLKFQNFDHKIRILYKEIKFIGKFFTFFSHFEYEIGQNIFIALKKYGFFHPRSCSNNQSIKQCLNRKALKELIAAWPNIEDLIKGRSLWRKGK